MYARPREVLRLIPLLLLVACGDPKPTPGEPVPVPPEGPSAAEAREDASAEPAEAPPATPADDATPVATGPQPGQGEFVAYRETVGRSSVAIEMVPVPGGTFVMGSPDGEAGRRDDEGPQIEVQVEPFWMGKYEVRWDEYDVWNTDEDRPQSKKPDGMARPTPAYMEMTFNMGREGYPAICMSHVAARQYCEWLSKQTGHFYRLPTEAEWEYACRAGSRTSYAFGDDPAQLGEYAWYAENSPRELEPGASPEPAYHKVGTRKPNAFGLYDMHGNVAEWVADSYREDAYASFGDGPVANPFVELVRSKNGLARRYPHPCRGGSWKHAAGELRSAARLASEWTWNDRDPQVPKSWWYLTDGQHVGFRVVRPLREPTDEERARFHAP